MIRILAICSCAMLLAACGTPRKTYHAPSDAKVKAATVDLNVKVARARATAERVKKAAAEARVIHERSIKRAGTLKELLAKLTVNAPEDYKGPLRQITDDLDAIIADNTSLKEKQNELEGLIEKLQGELTAAERARVTLQNAQDEYAGAAAGLANDATNERNDLVACRNENIKYKIIGWLWKLGGGAFVILIIALIIAWWTGKFAFKFMK